MGLGDKWGERLRHMFAVDPSGSQEPTADQQKSVDWVCMQVAKRHLTTPALIGLEMSRPLNYVASQGLQFAAPGVWAIVQQQTYADYQHFAKFLEHRGSVDYLVSRIEHFENELETRESSPDAGTGGS